MKKAFSRSLFYLMQNMNFREKVQELLTQFLQQRKDLFLIEINISKDNNINITIDGDNGVSIQDCLDTSRAIENNLDREQEDFSLQVSSFGITEPLQLPRQYQKNINRTIQVKTNTQNIKGKILQANNENITLIWEEKIPKETGKGKQKVQKTANIPYTEIQNAKIQISFN